MNRTNRASAVITVLVLIVFTSAMAFMFTRDRHAVHRCHRLGGQTYDSGQHCTIGGRTISTR